MSGNPMIAESTKSLSSGHDEHDDDDVDGRPNLSFNIVKTTAQPYKHRPRVCI